MLRESEGAMLDALVVLAPPRSLLVACTGQRRAEELTL